MVSGLAFFTREFWIIHEVHKLNVRDIARDWVVRPHRLAQMGREQERDGLLVENSLYVTWGLSWFVSVRKTLRRTGSSGNWRCCTEDSRKIIPKASGDDLQIEVFLTNTGKFMKVTLSWSQGFFPEFLSVIQDTKEQTTTQAGFSSPSLSFAPFLLPKQNKPETKLAPAHVHAGKH